MPELSRGRRFLVLAICCMSLLMVSLDNTVLNVALPSMQRELHTTISGLQWTIDAYTVVLASLLMLSGSTADRIGRRRTFQVGLAVFTLASLLCSLAPGLPWLVGFRMLQAVGGSMLNPVAMSIITNVFTEPKERARAIGVWGGVVGISMSAGPVIGGLLVETTGWRAIFWLNVPVGLLTLTLTRLFVPESRAPKPRRVDPVGQSLMILLLAGTTYAIIQTPAQGIGDPLIVSCVVIAVLSLAGLLWYEPRCAEPLLDLRFFRSAPFTGATVIAICGFAALGGFLFLNTLYLQNLRHLDALHAGLMMLPMAVMSLFFAPLSGRIVGTRGPRLPLLLAGTAMCACGVGMALLFSATVSLDVVVAAYLAFGIGFGLVNAPITNTAVSGMPRAQAGVAAAVASTSRQIGTSLGVAVIGSVMASGAAGGYAAGFVTASRTAWWIIAGCGAAVFLVGSITSGRWARRTADRTADRLKADEIRMPVSA
ncbi:MFS transporter [Streptantibioticus rubrisoli]|uniref:MFS transporter n=1 Tax=Streptantibioticus rubrisoli TaxID=1387313 RepID=A0ABT1PDY5_9ACTN|nr:MFS transporter [Streptantibioticus rubrisoli]MCQ4043579.1 MFS transporter [Streptantibioticus rubrisoli]